MPLDKGLLFKSVNLCDPERLCNWLKRSSLSGLTDGVEDLLDISSVDRLSFIRQSSKVKFTSAVKLSESGAVGPEYARDEEENFFKRLGPHGFQERLAASQEAMKNKNVVNLGAIRQGMKRFQFLLNCCEPGTIPDASILAAALDLEAPVVARASLFLECARFVHRCNRGNWPEWMKGHHVNITKRGLSRGRSPIVGNKRNQKLQWNAAKYFCQWGDAIGTRLSELCHSDSESPANILGYIFDEETKRRMRKEDEEEDYLDDNTVNPTKCGCPFALKMAACQLLLEITTFLRETFPCLPRPRTEPLVDLDSCRLRLDPELGRHRYERKISAMIEILPIQHFTVFLMTALEHDINKSFSARVVSRSHQRAEHILKNLQQEEEKRRLGRQASIITAIPVAQEACYEPTCSPPPEQEEEAEEVVNLASRRLSVSPSCASSNSHRNYSFRRGSVWSVRSLASAEDEENTTEHTPTHHMLQPPQAVFPACICAAVLPIVHLMEDGEVREDGVAVSAVAQQILWNCLIEDPALVLRHFLEKLTVSNRQDELMYMLRKLLLNIGDLPAQTSHILFNYLVYADYESDPLLRQGIEFCCRQFYILHRKPFILQLFASVAPLLEFTTSTSTGLSKGVSAQCLFDLLVSLEGETQDALDALELVKAEKPLRSLDFCYGNEDLTFSISEAIKLCVTVVAYAPESFRSLQMLMVLEALVPCHLQKLKSNTVTMESASAARDEIAAIAALATSLQALLYSSEALTRPMTAPQMSRCDQGHKGGTTANHAMSGGVNTRDNLHLLEEGQGMPREELDERIAREEFRRPRESLLNICTEFYKHCGPRLKILQNVAGEPRVTALELLDIKSHMRLAEIAHALLKLAPYDTLTMES
ncbi:Protein unc-80 -like protein [Collichthys lucidus]|uniref:Protein unc-80-like protein n=1 Tax=Collichthys lucidus TaxID=240159 RepID=A0A4U5TUE4_COLLU|nr:Protein unc-80 -like protein [Collichthys lucidus]